MAVWEVNYSGYRRARAVSMHSSFFSAKSTIDEATLVDGFVASVASVAEIRSLVVPQ